MMVSLLDCVKSELIASARTPLSTRKNLAKLVDLPEIQMNSEISNAVKKIVFTVSRDNSYV